MQNLMSKKMSLVNSDTNDSLDEVTENMDSNDFTSERLTTPGAEMRSLGDWSQDFEEKFKNLTVPQRNKLFHDVMDAFQSIVIQPEGDSLKKSCQLDNPIFILRDMPVKEQYKKAKKQVEELLHPELADKR